MPPAVNIGVVHLPSGWMGLKVHEFHSEEKGTPMPSNPGGNGLWFLLIIAVWRSLRPLKKFLGLTVAEFEAELKPCSDVRQEITDLENKLIDARKRRDERDAEGLDLVNRLVNAIKSDKTEGADSALLEGFGYTIPSKRKSGLHRIPSQKPAESIQKAA